MFVLIAKSVVAAKPAASKACVLKDILFSLLRTIGACQNDIEVIGNETIGTTANRRMLLIGAE